MRTLAWLRALMPMTAYAETHDVAMLTRSGAGAMIYDPPYLEIAPGDTVRFLPVQGGHNAASIPEMLPEGAERFIGGIDEKISVTFGIEGRYGIKCSPHYGMGMVMIVDVGEVAEAPIPDGVPARARERMEEFLGQ